jgi:two-component system nitrogen regulation sensor histidine kinase GlnL
MIEIEQQTRLDREERTHGQAQANKELVRNLAHEIKNPLGGIRGAAQLLAMELDSRELTEYTQVIIHEADRLQAWWTGCWRRTAARTWWATSTSTRSASGCAR